MTVLQTVLSIDFSPLSLPYLQSSSQLQSNVIQKKPSLLRGSAFDPGDSTIAGAVKQGYFSPHHPAQRIALWSFSRRLPALFLKGPTATFTPKTWNRFEEQKRHIDTTPEPTTRKHRKMTKAVAVLLVLEGLR